MGIKVEFSEQSLSNAEQIYSPKVADELRNPTALFEIVTSVGSRISRDSLKEEFGGHFQMGDRSFRFELYV